MVALRRGRVGFATGGGLDDEAGGVGGADGGERGAGVGRTREVQGTETAVVGGVGGERRVGQRRGGEERQRLGVLRRGEQADGGREAGGGLRDRCHRHGVGHEPDRREAPGRRGRGVEVSAAGTGTSGAEPPSAGRLCH